jgi:hypothetical protein
MIAYISIDSEYFVVKSMWNKATDLQIQFRKGLIFESNLQIKNLQIKRMHEFY